jgi:hypothetical protein
MASGDTLVVFTPFGNEQPGANGATLDVRNNQPVLDFDAGTDEYAVFSGILPRSYAGSGLTVTLWCMMTSATSNNVIMQAAIERRNTDADSDSFAAAQSSAATAVNGTSGIPFAVTIAFTAGAQMDSLAAGEPFRIKVNRDADNGSDNAAGDLELLAVEIKET